MAIQSAYFNKSFDQLRSMRDVGLTDLFNDSVIGISNSLLEKNREMGAMAEDYPYAAKAGVATLGNMSEGQILPPMNSANPFARPTFSDTPMQSAESNQNFETPKPKNLLGFVKEFEGFNPNAYGDYKQTSIGYGTRARPGETMISRDEAERRLSAELASSRQRVLRHAEQYGYEFNQNQLDALTSFDYNTGRLEQLTAKGTRTPDIIARQMLLYNKAGGKTLSGLDRRRKAESSLFQSS